MQSLTAGQLPMAEETASGDGHIKSNIASESALSDVKRKLRNLVVRADCMKFMNKLPADVIDCVITSPPYNKMNGIPYNAFDDSLQWDDYRDNQVAVLTELYRITKPGGHLWYVHKVQHYDKHIMHPMEWISKSPWKIQNEITWHRRSCVNCNLYRFRGLDERIYWLMKPGPKEFGLNPNVSKWGSVWFTPDDRRIMNNAFPIRHPATYSLYLMLAILHAMNLPAGSLIYDPYGGSGTTAKASHVSNHYYVTTEFDREYVKVIKTRLEKTIEADEFLILIVMKQIMTNTLDLSRNLKLPQLQSLLLVEPWELPEMKSEENVQTEIVQRYRSKKMVYYRKHPRRRVSSRKTANFTYSNRPELCRYVRPRRVLRKNRWSNTAWYPSAINKEKTS